VRVYYGWVIVAIAVVTFALVVGASMQSFGLFVLPVSRAFGLTRAEMNTGAILLNLGMAFASPFLGRIVDRFPARPIILVSGLVFGGSIVVLGLSTSPLLSAVVMALPLGAAVVGGGTLTSPALVSRWFTVHRSRALAIATIGISMGPIVVTPLLGRMIEAVGWREALVVLGIVSGLLLAAMAMLARNFPGPNDIEPGAAELHAQRSADDAPAGPALTIGQLLRLPQFWTLAIACALVFAVLTADIVSLIPLAQGNGLSIASSASLMSVYGVCAVLGALIFAGVGDRFGQAVIFAIMAVTIGVANAGLMLFHDYTPVVICAGLMGLTGGMTSPGFMALLAEYFGIASFGIAIGTASLVSTLFSAVAVRFGGEVFDRTGHYDLMLLTFFVTGLLAAALLIVTRLIVRVRKPSDPVPLEG
jgi:MFS family permease